MLLSITPKRSLSFGGRSGGRRDRARQMIISCSVIAASVRISSISLAVRRGTSHSSKDWKCSIGMCCAFMVHVVLLLFGEFRMLFEEGGECLLCVILVVFALRTGGPIVRL